MKKALLPISLFLVFASLVLIAGCSKDDDNTPTNNPPAAPVFTAAQANRHYVAFGWTVSNADCVYIQQSTDSSTWSRVAYVAGTLNSFIDSSISANTKYHFRASAINANGASGYSNTVDIWTLPAAYDFSDSSDVDHFTASALENAADPEWSWDATAEAGMLVLPEEGPADSASLVTDYTMPNAGWFESRLKVEQWHGTGDSASYANFFLEVDPSDQDNSIALLFSADSTILGYYSSGAGAGIQRIATNPDLPTLSHAAFHTIRFHHIGASWELFIDGTSEWTGSIPNVAGSGALFQEWQFTGGYGPAGQMFWVDDVANPATSPAFTAHGARSLDNAPHARAVAKHK